MAIVYHKLMRMGQTRQSSLLSALLLLFAILYGQCKETHTEGDPFSICVQRNHQGLICPLSVEAENCTPLTQTTDLAGQFNHEDTSNTEVKNWVLRSSNIVCVDEFGAEGDGENDDTKAFNDAWNKACSSAPAVLLVPHGKKYLVKPIRFSGPCKSALTMQLMLYAGSDAPEYHVPHSTQGQDIPSTDPVSHTKIPDPSRGKAVMEVGSMVVSTEEISGKMPNPTRGEAVMEAGTETPGPFPGVVSPHRPYVNKGQVYMRRPTPRKSEVVRDHGDSDTMEPEFTVENLAGIVDAAVSAASTMATSHTEPPSPPPPPGPSPSGSTMDATIIHVQPTAPSATQETQSPLSQSLTEDPEMHTGTIVVPTGSPSRKNKRKLEF